MKLHSGQSTDAVGVPDSVWRSRSAIWICYSGLGPETASSYCTLMSMYRQPQLCLLEGAGMPLPHHRVCARPGRMRLAVFEACGGKTAR